MLFGTRQSSLVFWNAQTLRLELLSQQPLIPGGILG